MLKFLKFIFGSLIVLTIGIPHSHAQELYFEKVLTRDGEANLSVRQIIQDKNGFLWLATFSGLYRYEGDEYLIPHEFQNNAEINNDVTCLVQDLENNIWIGTRGGLILCDDFSDLETGNFQIMNVFQDQSGCVWIGTETGLNKFDPVQNQFKQLGGEAIDQLSEQTATSFCAYGEGVLILTLSHGISFDDGKNIGFVADNNLLEQIDENLYSIMVGTGNNIWLGGYNGSLISLDLHSQTFTAINIHRTIPQFI